MTEPLSCIWVCVCAEHELLSDTWTDCCEEHVHWLCEVTLRQSRTHTHHARTSLWVPQPVFHCISAWISACTMFFKEKSYIMTIKGSKFGWTASSGSNKGVTDGDSLTDTHRPALWTCLWNLLLQMGALKWTIRSTAPRNISRTNWDRRNPAGKTLPYSTALHSYQARLWFLSSFHSITLTPSSSISRRLFVSVLCTFLSQAWDWWRQRLEWFIRKTRRRRWRSRCL